MKRCLYHALATIGLLSIVVACAPAAPTAAPATAPAAPTKPAAPPAALTPTAAPKPAAATPTPAPKIKRGGVLRTARVTDIETTDIHMATGGDPFYFQLYDGLTRHDPDLAAGKWEIKPELAEAWELSNPKTIVMKLRKGVKFQDGSDFNATAAKWNLDRLGSHPKSRGKELVANLQSVDVVDDYTIRLNLKSPFAGQLMWFAIGPSLNHGGIVSKAAVEKMGDAEFGRKGVGTGPFELVEYTTGNRTITKRFEGYWAKGEDGKPLPYLDQVVSRFIPDWSVALLELKTGNIDSLTLIEPKDVAGVQKDANLNYVPFLLRDGWRYAVGIQANSKPWSGDVRLRRALSVALNREAVASTLGFGEGFPWYVTWSPYELGYDASIPKDTYDVNQAKKLLQEAGYPNGIDLTLSVISRQVDVRTAEVYKQMWDAAGIRTTIDSMERSAWIAKTESGNLDVTTFNISAHSDPDQYSINFAKDGAYNWLRYENPELDKCLVDGRSSMDEKQRADIYKRCLRIVHDDAFFIAVWGLRSNDVYQKYVKGYLPQWQYWDARYVWLDK